MTSEVVNVQSQYISTQFEIELTPLNGPSPRKTFQVSSEGIFGVLEAPNSMAGVAVLNATSQVFVSNTQVSASTRFTLSFQDGVEPSGVPYILSRSIGSGFTIAVTGVSNGTSVYYQLWNNIV